MWFVFPQVAAGYHQASRTCAISSPAEARGYLAHPVLGRRLIECAAILAAGGPRRTRSSAKSMRSSCARR